MKSMQAEMMDREAAKAHAPRPDPVAAIAADTLSANGFLTADENGLGIDSGTGGMVTPEKLAAMQPYPGVDYLGMGYDIFTGNPEGDDKSMNDAGFKEPVHMISYQGVTMTRDNQYLLPDGAYGSPMHSCYRTQVMQARSFTPPLILTCCCVREHALLEMEREGTAAVPPPPPLLLPPD